MAVRESTVQPMLRSGGWRMSRRAKVTFVPAFVLALTNFAVFIALDIYLGGDALNGYARDRQYFLCSHGKYSEVSEPSGPTVRSDEETRLFTCSPNKRCYSEKWRSWQ